MSEIIVNLSRSGWVGGAGLSLRGSLALDDRLASVDGVSRHAQGRLSAKFLARLGGGVRVGRAERSGRPGGDGPHP